MNEVNLVEKKHVPFIDPNCDSELTWFDGHKLNWLQENICFPAPPHELTEEEKQQILHSEEFLSFFDHSTRIVERALSEQINIFFDYSGRDLEDKEG